MGIRINPMLWSNSFSFKVAVSFIAVKPASPTAHETADSHFSSKAAISSKLQTRSETPASIAGVTRKV